MSGPQPGGVEVNSHASAANVARTVCIANQDNTIGAAQSSSSSSWKNSNNNTHFVTNNNYATLPTPWPPDPAVAYILNRLLPRDAAIWSVEQGLFVSPDEYARQHNKMNVRSMMYDTINVFEHIASFFTELLNHGRSFMKEKDVEHMELQIQNIAAVLSAADAKAKSMGKVNPDDGVVLHAPQAGEYSQIRIIGNALVRLLSSSNRISSQSIDDNPLPSHQGGIFLHDLDEATRRGMSRQFPTLTPEEGLTISDLSNYLKFDKTALRKDVERCSSVSIVKPPSMMQRLSKLTRRDEFQGWLLKTSQASAIVVHGNFQERIAMTPLSYLCARIVKEYTGKPGFIILAHFCGLHANVRTQDADPKAMLTCLIRQLLLQPAVVGTYDSQTFDKHLLKGLKNRNIETLGKIFKALIRQLRSQSMVVFCLIDSISYYEDPGRKRDTREVLSVLKEVVASQRGRQRKNSDKIAFKLMITAGGKSVNASEYFSRDRILEMNELVDGNTRLKLS
ncbi:hypothetical protein PG993_014020 [Apiospora rasikravindrae]|uniref:Uncharacterized protein n=1 Tax=Apiospora rasikravindrae TaxID=990691 RepID=A0ABR1RRV2_9PEZI